MLPDQAKTSLMNDKQNYAHLSTFLDNGKILLAINNRFLIFKSENGDFEDQVQFYDGRVAKRQNQIMNVIKDTLVPMMHRPQEF